MKGSLIFDFINFSNERNESYILAFKRNFVGKKILQRPKLRNWNFISSRANGDSDH